MAGIGFFPSSFFFVIKKRKTNDYKTDNKTKINTYNNNFYSVLVIQHIANLIVKLIINKKLISVILYILYFHYLFSFISIKYIFYKN